MKRLLREPLVQFMLGGAGLFILYALTATDPGTSDTRIVISGAQIESLAAMFERTWMRPPQPDELDSLIENFVDDEILYREALALGLDRNDLVIRRRLRQKMEFLNADLVEPPEPSEEDLATYLESHPERFAEPARITFEQVFLKPTATGAATQARAEDALERLRAGQSAGSLGDATQLPNALELVSAIEIDSVFGAGFGNDVMRAPEGIWTGPLASSFGLHLVRITTRAPLRMRELASIRKIVEREWRAEQRSNANERALERLRERYQVEIDSPRSEIRRAPAES